MPGPGRRRCAQAFANDLGDSRSLVGVTDNVNQAKGDQDPPSWMPTYDKCRYLREWVAVKHRWRLTVDSGEKSALDVARVRLHQHHDHGDARPLSVAAGRFPSTGAAPAAGPPQAAPRRRPTVGLRS